MGADPLEHDAEQFLCDRLRTLQQDNRLPLLSTDLDDTFLPFGAMLGDKELQVLTAYLETGAYIAFNTLAPKESFYLRVMERMASAFHRKHRARLFSRSIGLFQEARKSSFTNTPITAIGESTSPRREARVKAYCT